MLRSKIARRIVAPVAAVGIAAGAAFGLGGAAPATVTPAQSAPSSAPMRLAGWMVDSPGLCSRGTKYGCKFSKGYPA